MNWLVLAFALQLGYTPNDTVWQYNKPPEITFEQGQVLVDMDAEVRAWNMLYIGGSLGVPVAIETGEAAPNLSVEPGAWPSALQSIFRAGVRFGGVEIGWSHLCTHPVMPYQPMFGQQTLWEGGYDEFHVKFSGSVNLF
jgi:hypothetical protein